VVAQSDGVVNRTVAVIFRFDRRRSGGPGHIPTNARLGLYVMLRWCMDYYGKKGYFGPNIN